MFARHDSQSSNIADERTVTKTLKKINLMDAPHENHSHSERLT